MQELEEKIAATKQRLEETRSAHLQQHEVSDASLEQARNRLRVLEKCFQRRVQKSNGASLSYYGSIIEQVYPCWSLPDSVTLRKQSIMLHVSHRIEVIRKATELLQDQSDSLATYMKCEIAVLAGEQDEMRNAFVQEKQIMRQAWDCIEQPLRHKLRVYENAKNNIQSLIDLQRDIRSHSFHTRMENDSNQHHHSKNDRMNNDSSSSQSHNSFATLDFHQSLSLVSSTFVDSFRKLPQQNDYDDDDDSPTRMVDLMKQLLILDGTFPTKPEDDDLFENSSKDWSRLEELISSH